MSSPGLDPAPVVSVCVQTYQHAQYIARCLQGILEQTCTFDFEILLGEDASTDGTREICLEYADRHPDRIRLSLHDRKNVIFINGRPTGRFNLITNLKMARGQYIAFCDGDDYWNDKEKLQKQVGFLEQHPDYAISYHNMRLASPDGQLLDSWKLGRSTAGTRAAESLASRMFIPLGTAVIRRSALSIPEQFSRVVNGDTFLLAVVGQHGQARYHGDINDAVAHIHPGGIWSPLTQIQKCKANTETFFAIRETIDPRFRTEINSHIAQRYRQVLSLALKTGQPLEFLSSSWSLLRVLNFNPLEVLRAIARKQTP